MFTFAWEMNEHSREDFNMNDDFWYNVVIFIVADKEITTYDQLENLIGIWLSPHE